ncbi:MAG: hypothetical protein EBX40_03770 [Gammaproteobacteria bacterium]|nr:hypothetical protein [Gammaproteobacteria bacterium]
MPGPANPYPTIASNLNQESIDVLAAFTNAETELNTYSASSVRFLEIEYNGIRILRIWDGSQVSGLPSSEQYRLYSQLGGLFNLAMRTMLYP